MSDKAQMENLKREVSAFIDHRFNEYTQSPLFQNWKLLCENIRDAVNQQWRPGEQLTRNGAYVAAMRSTRDGFKEGFTDTFGQADPLFVFKRRRGIPEELATKAEEALVQTWEDMDGLQCWLALTDDAIDYGMGIGYTHWCRHSDEVEVPVVTQQAWGDEIEWRDEFNILLDQPALDRIHPFNYRADMRRGRNLEWEGCEWEWTLEHLCSFIGNALYDQAALQRVINKVSKGETSGGSSTYYNTTDDLGGTTKPGARVWAKEYWGDIRGVQGRERDSAEYTIIKVEDEIIRFNINKIHTHTRYRPFKRVQLVPTNDSPLGLHLLAPVLPHQKLKNLTVNLATDDLIMRQHLGLAVWRQALENPNDLLNPEGARGVVYMRKDASPNLLPRFFADSRSGLLQDVMQFDRDVTERDMQMAGLPQQALGLTGGVQDGTATAARFLASNTNRRSRSAILWACETGLKPIARDVMLLMLRHRPPEDMELTNDELIQIWKGNKWTVGDVVTQDQVQANLALANWGQMAMQKLSEVTQRDGSADHVVQYLKDLGKTMGIPRSRLDEYLPDPKPVAVDKMPNAMGPGMPPGPPGSPMAAAPGPKAGLLPPASATENTPSQAPMTFSQTTPEEETANA